MRKGKVSKITQNALCLEEFAHRLDLNIEKSHLTHSKVNRHRLENVVNRVKRMQIAKEPGDIGVKGFNGVLVLIIGSSGARAMAAAKALAIELALDLYRVDLFAIVSKYIGETEKNLRRVFDQAEANGVILFFDEADALFGKRTEVKSGHDRYTNKDVCYLLKRAKECRGIIILATDIEMQLHESVANHVDYILELGNLNGKQGCDNNNEDGETNPC